MNSIAELDDAPARRYARLLLHLHDLIATGHGDEPDADALRNQLDAPWHAMSAAEQDRVGGLSEDLYALAEHSPRAATMPAEERRRWGQDFGTALAAGTWDRALALLRRPPSDVPPQHVAYFQADCWDHLGCPEVALRFMRAATRLNPARAVSELTLQLPREVG